MYRYLPQRIAYGRAVRDEAERLMYRHGLRSVEEAGRIVREHAGDPEAQAFHKCVAARVERMLGHQPGTVDYRQVAGMRGAS